MAHVDRDADGFTVLLEDGRRLRADGILNASYAGTNQVLTLLGEAPLSLKYELCEIILTNGERRAPRRRPDGHGRRVLLADALRPLGFPLADLRRVHPHRVSHDATPHFSCQARNPVCNDTALDNCSFCPEAPASSWPFVSQMTRRYLGDRHTVRFGESLYAVKTVLKTHRGGRRPADDDHPAQRGALADLGPLRKDRDDLRPGRGPVKQHKFISVVIRCHNAEKRIPHFLAAVDNALQRAVRRLRDRRRRRREQ